MIALYAPSWPSSIASMWTRMHSSVWLAAGTSTWIHDGSRRFLSPFYPIGSCRLSRAYWKACKALESRSLSLDRTFRQFPVFALIIGLQVQVNYLFCSFNIYRHGMHEEKVRGLVGMAADVVLNLYIQSQREIVFIFFLDHWKQQRELGPWWSKVHKWKQRGACGTCSRWFAE